MNLTTNDSFSSTPTCSLQARVYTDAYLYFKVLNSTYLRLLIGPGILLNTLCLLVLSRPRLSNKSTTIVFLRVLALFDILAITLKYVRAEINYQSIEKNRQIFLLIPPVCKTLYVLMNASISISMWTIVLMSLDKAVAVSYPLKSSIWVTQKRAFYICCIMSLILISTNLSFIQFSGILKSRTRRDYCGLVEGSFLIDLLTASILPIGLITAANVVITVVLHRGSSGWSKSESSNDKRDSNAASQKHELSTPTHACRSSLGSGTAPIDIILANKRRTNAQVTRMLLAVTLSLIICNIPNTVFFVFVKVFDTRQLLVGRVCAEVSDSEIKLYKFGFYSSVLQDILSDLPHIVNFFLYCLAGKKFRSIFANEVRQFLVELHLIKRTQRRLTQSTCGYASELLAASPLMQSNRRLLLANVRGRQSADVLFNGKTTKTVVNQRRGNSTIANSPRYSNDTKTLRSNSSAQ